MYGILIAIFLMVCVGLVISILLQSAKGEGLAGAFGGSSLTGTVFGGRGAASFLSKATTYLGALFMLMAIALSMMRPTTGQSALQGGSAVEEAARQNPAPPATPPLDAGVGEDAATGQPPPAQQPADQATPVEELFNESQTQTQQQTPPPDQPADSGQ